MVNVFIDGVPVGVPGGWAARPDLTSLFPHESYSGIGSALGVFGFDSTRLSNGLHTIAWGVTDSHGGGAGVGSRFFTVSNGSALTGTPSTARANSARASMSGGSELQGRRGFDLDAPVATYRPNQQGVVVVNAEELDRIELRVGATSGHLRTGSGLQPLPVGARLAPADGSFTWQPGVAFVGPYDFVFDGPGGRRDVRIVLNPRGSNRVGPQVVIDAPFAQQNLTRSFVVGGWAIDLDSPVGPGVDAVHVWAYPVAGGAPIFLGPASVRGQRPDVGAIYGETFEASGYGLSVEALAPGRYDLAVFAWSSVKHDFVPARTVRVTVR